MQLEFDFPSVLEEAKSDKPDHRESLPAARAECAELEDRRRQLSSELRMHLQSPVAVVLHTNRQSMLSAQRTRLGFHYRLHRIFALAPPEVVTALARLVERSDRESANTIDRYIELNVDAIAELARLTPVETRGEHFDLAEILSRLNAAYFDGAVQSRITWGRAAALRRRSIKLGSYHATERLIRIHPALDQAFVPAYFLEFVVFHEMLHERLGSKARASGGRRCVHPPEFRALEARFPRAADALKWERESLNRLLRYKPGG